MKWPLPVLMWYAKHGPFATFRHSALRKISRGYNGVERDVMLDAGFRMQVRIGDPVDTAIAVMGHFELGLTRLISRLAPSLESFVDVGCNIGHFTCLFRRINSIVPVLSIDANPRMIERAKANAQSNQFSDIIWENIGIGQHEGELTLHINDERPSQASFGAGKSQPALIRAHQIRVEPLSTVIARSGIDSIGLLKIDIEGFEPALFQGLPLEFMSRIKRMVFEYAPDHMAKCGFPQDALARLPWWNQYRCFGMKGDGPTLVPLRPGEFTGDWDGIYAERIDLPIGLRQ
jgi:FkbM family methyltransferase